MLSERELVGFELKPYDVLDSIKRINKNAVLYLALALVAVILYFTSLDVILLPILAIIALHPIAIVFLNYVCKRKTRLNQLLIQSVINTFFISLIVMLSGGFISPFVALYIGWLGYLALKHKLDELIITAILASILFFGASLLEAILFQANSEWSLLFFIRTIISMAALSIISVYLIKELNVTKKKSDLVVDTFEVKINELANINSLLTQLSRLQRLDSLLKVFAHEIKELLSASTILVFLKKNENGFFCKKAVGSKIHKLDALKKPFNDLIFDEIRHLKQPLILSSKELNVLMPTLYKKIKLQNALFVPLQRGDDILGVVCCLNKKAGFNDDDLKIMSAINRQISVMLENATLFERMNLKTADLEKINLWLNKNRKAFINILEDINQANNSLEKALHQSLTMYRIAVELSKSLDESQLLEAILSNSADLVGAKSGFLVLVHGSSLYEATRFNYQGDLHLSGAKTPIKWIMNHKKALVINDFENTAYHSYGRAAGIANFIGVPLIQRNKCIGVLCLVNKTHGFARQDSQNLVTLAHQATVTLINARVHENEKKTVAKLQELDKMKADFVASVSHELRSPLTTIKGYLDLVMDQEAGPINKEQQEYLAIIDHSSDRLLHLINDLLTISKIESASLKMKKRLVSINDVLETVAKVMQPEAVQKGLKLKVKLAKGLPQVMADGDRLDQVVINLVSNALKFTPKDGTVELASEVVNNMLVLSVKDSGLGIAAEDQKNLFKKFYRSQEAVTRNIKGTGLGLAIAKGIIEQHHGKIWLESKIGKGSTFYFSLPIKKKTAA